MARKRRPLPPPPQYSSRLYVRVRPELTRDFRYLLEAYDNLACTSVVDRRACILKVFFSPHQRKELQECLAGIRQSLEFEVLDVFRGQASLILGEPHHADR